MNKIDQDLKKFLIKKAPDLASEEWLNGMFADYENSISCYNCKSTDTEFIVGPLVTVKCRACGLASPETFLTLDEIPKISYGAVKFLQKEKIVEILEAQEKYAL